MAFKTLTTTVEQSAVGRVDLVVRDLSELSRSQVRGLFDHDCVKVNEMLCKDIGTEVAAGDVVEICFDPHTRYKEKKRKWDDRTFTIVHEDDFLIVVDKAAGTLTVPTGNSERNTLVDRVSKYLNHSRRNKAAWVVDRLDRDTSGLLVFAKQEQVEKALIEQFKQKRPERVYVAIVAGVIASDEGSLESHLTVARDLSVSSGPENRFSEFAVTNYKVLRRNMDTTLVELTVGSTVRNQIRVQLADEGHPILGDTRFGEEAAQHYRWVRRRMALHVRALTFMHPATGKVMNFECPLPSAIQKFMSGCRGEKAKAASSQPGATDTLGAESATDAASTSPESISPWAKAASKYREQNRKPGS